MNDKADKKKIKSNPIQLEDLLPQEDIQGGTGSRKTIFGAVKRNATKSDRKSNKQQ